MSDTAIHGPIMAAQMNPSPETGKQVIEYLTGTAGEDERTPNLTGVYFRDDTEGVEGLAFGSPIDLDEVLLFARFSADGAAGSIPSSVAEIVSKLADAVKNDTEVVVVVYTGDEIDKVLRAIVQGGEGARFFFEHVGASDEFAEAVSRGIRNNGLTPEAFEFTARFNRAKGIVCSLFDDARMGYFSSGPVTESADEIEEVARRAATAMCRAHTERVAYWRKQAHALAGGTTDPIFAASIQAMVEEPEFVRCSDNYTVGGEEHRRFQASIMKAAARYADPDGALRDDAAKIVGLGRTLGLSDEELLAAAEGTPAEDIVRDLIG